MRRWYSCILNVTSGTFHAVARAPPAHSFEHLILRDAVADRVEVEILGFLLAVEGVHGDHVLELVDFETEA